MALQKVTNYCVTQNYLITAAYISTPHSSKFACLVFDDFYPKGHKCLAIPLDDFLRNQQLLTVRG